MKRYRITEAKEAAQRFIDAVDAMQDREQADDYFRRMLSIGGFKETAAVKRSSLDLTRALARMRTDVGFDE